MRPQPARTLGPLLLALGFIAYPACGDDPEGSPYAPGELGLAPVDAVRMDSAAARYDDLRKKNMSVFGDVRDGVCQGCSVKLVPTELAEHRRGVAIHYCKSCGRFMGELL